MGGTPQAPTPPAMLPEAPHTPVTQMLSGALNADARRKAMAAGSGGISTILTGAQGLAPSQQVQGATKTLLGG